ncbi:TPA: hypothetical protein ACLET2_001910, partial [Pseudomonas aeruginosa]
TMQANQPQGGDAKASTPRYDTIVIRGATGKDVPREVDGGEVVAWSAGHELAALDALQEFVDNLAAGNCSQHSHLTHEAAAALNLMRRRRAIGWAADEPTEHPPADWKTAVACAVATAFKVFGENTDEAMDAIRYMEALLLAKEPAEPKPFMFVQLHDGDVQDWTRDANRAESWEEDGYTVAKLFIAPSPSNSTSQAWLDVQAERRRQITAEGWTPEHDDEHSHGQMARAAACYALAGSSAPNDETAALLVSLAWPWDQQWWKPTTARRDLVKACTLALAEIERLDRAAAALGGAV